jgi:hypothetical protein
MKNLVVQFGSTFAGHNTFTQRGRAPPAREGPLTRTQTPKAIDMVFTNNAIAACFLGVSLVQLFKLDSALRERDLIHDFTPPRLHLKQE